MAKALFAFGCFPVGAVEHVAEVARKFLPVVREFLVIALVTNPREKNTAGVIRPT